MILILFSLSFWETFSQQFQQTSLLEWLGFLATIACIFLAAKANVWNWPISIISVVISAVLYFRSHLFGDFLLQFYFLFTAFYGWWYWIKKKTEEDKPIVSLKKMEWFLVLLSIILLTFLLGYLLDRHTVSTVPYEDGFCTAVSLVAQFLLTRKILENWILWIIVDICYVPLLLSKGLVLYALLYAILVIIAVQGYTVWRKIYHEQSN